jgi:hypothetical protein
MIAASSTGARQVTGPAREAPAQGVAAKSGEYEENALFQLRLFLKLPR